MIDKIFFILSALTIISATMVVVSKHPIRSVLFLVLTFFLISAHYVLLNAQFLALLLCLVFAVTLSLRSGSDTDVIFGSIFVLIWIGGFVVTLNARLLGGNVSFFQSIYCQRIRVG